MKRGAIGILLVGAVACGGLYYLSPYWTLLRIEEAAKARDVVTLEALIDWPRVRAGVKEDLRSQMASDSLAGLRKSEGAAAAGHALGSALAANMIDNLVDGLVNPNTIARRAESADVALLKNLGERGFHSLSRFQAEFVLPDDAETRFTAVLEFSMPTWRVVRVLIPDMNRLQQEALKGR